jgi:hypothetical protein
MFADAIDNWPEDEANLTADFALDLFDHHGRDYYHAWLIKERGTLHNLFNDDESLIERFKIKFNSITANETGFYI